MRINRINLNNIKIQNQSKNVYTEQKENAVQYCDYKTTPSFVFKQYAISFSGNEKKPEDKKSEENDFNKEKIAEWAKQISTLPPEEQKDAVDNIVKGLFSYVFTQTIKEREQIKVPEGLSKMEEILFKSVVQLTDKKFHPVKNPDNVVIFSNAFVTQAIEPQISTLPISAPIFTNKEFLDLFQSLNVIENNAIGNIIKFAFQNKNEIVQHKLFNKFTLMKNPAIEEEHWARYDRTPNSFVYVEENESGSSLTKIMIGYKSAMFGEEKLSIVYGFDEDGNLSKIIKFNQESEIVAELELNNKDKTVTVTEPNKEQRLIKFENGEFIQ